MADMIALRWHDRDLWASLILAKISLMQYMDFTI
jgi:hypothetical protein